MNKTYIYAAISFVTGIAAGSVAGWFVSKKRYETMLEEQVESVKDIYARAFLNIDDEDNAHNSDILKNVAKEAFEQKRNHDEYIEIAGNYDSEIKKASNNQAVDYTKAYSDKDSIDDFPEATEDDCIPEINSPDYPRVLDDEEYYEIIDNDESWSKLEINLFDDGMITDEMYDPIEEPYKVIPKNALEAFMKNDKEYEIFTISESRHCVYSIMKAGQTWTEYLKAHPIVMETNYV